MNASNTKDPKSEPDTDRPSAGATSKPREWSQLHEDTWQAFVDAANEFGEGHFTDAVERSARAIQLASSFISDREA